MTQGPEAAGEHGVARDEGLGLGFIQQVEQMAAHGPDIRVREHMEEPAEIGGRVEFIRAGFWVGGWVAGCGARRAGWE